MKENKEHLDPWALTVTSGQNAQAMPGAVPCVLWSRGVPFQLLLSQPVSAPQLSVLTVGLQPALPFRASCVESIKKRHTPFQGLRKPSSACFRCPQIYA